MRQALMKSLHLQDSMEYIADHPLIKRSADFGHNVYETIAQASCTSMAIVNGYDGWVYTITRECPHQQTCSQICNSFHLRILDTETIHLNWIAIGAIHVYHGRPTSIVTKYETSTLGLKVLWVTDYEHHKICGPNYCCCIATH